MPAKSKSTRPTAEPLSGARVLVVDDHTFTISLVKDMLYAAGAEEVYTAQDGAEALAFLRACQPHLVVTDWRMPGLDGLAFIQIVRQAAVRPDIRVPDPAIPIVLLSAHASALAVETARRAGVTEVVVKPFTIATLLQKIAAAMGQPRPFVIASDYVGPDRRRGKRAGTAAARRAADVLALPAPSDDASVLKQLQAELDQFEQRPRRTAKPS